ncbi:MAG: CDP-paratose 2-epimerase [Limimaricola cinnabarinus]|jgi:CDP-paratose 2-epimerase|uniref:NAD-dependent epimerase/dehydratase family protein n=1 Tax=Limimaricola cinnabarinus TaxID=1125964 RepID=UPI0039E6BF15
MSEQVPGYVEWFRKGDARHVDEAVAGMKAAGVRRLRTQLSWAEWHEPDGADWYDWLLPRLGAAFDLMVCVHYTPPSISRTGRSSGAPERLRDYADFIDLMLTRHGAHIETVELWNEPNNLLDWDWREDPEHLLFTEMVGDAANWVRQRGFRVALGGPCPFDPVLLDIFGRRGLLAMVDAVGLHGFPGTWDSAEGSWLGWDAHLVEARKIVGRHAPDCEIWITEAGYSTWNHDELGQLQRFLDAARAPAERLYWYGWRDVAQDVAVQEGLWFDPRHYHLGVTDGANRPKLVARLLQSGGMARLNEVACLAAPRPKRVSGRPVVVTGGCGFIGANLADSLAADGDPVVVLDNLSRPGAEENLAWLRETHGPRIHPAVADIRQRGALDAALEGARGVVHLAAQTAVTTSLDDPVQDFDVNARGTLDLLQALRRAGGMPVVFASTNKVYGDLADLGMLRQGNRYLPENPHLRAHGVAEDRPLDFCTPYGCSKGVADQYVLDYAKSFGIPAAVLRMSCIYGPHQFGTEDQGWVAHFLLRALAGQPITIYGDGCQVRDVLHVGDAVAAYRAALDGIDAVSGRAFNLGGGPENAISLNMLLDEIGRLSGRAVDVRHDRTRPGDQLYFVADTTRFETVMGWRRRTGWRDGVTELWHWLARHRFDALPEGYGQERISA